MWMSPAIMFAAGGGRGLRLRSGPQDSLKFGIENLPSCSTQFANAGGVFGVGPHILTFWLMIRCKIRPLRN